MGVAVDPQHVERSMSMMYTLRPLSAMEFASDPDIRFPRFQRKSTWSNKQRFNLTLSVFHDYPLGMVVVRNQSGDVGRGHFVLDGRQRRETLALMRDPENIWQWAARCLKLKQGDSQADVHLKYVRYLNDYFGVEDWQQESLEEESPTAPDHVEEEEEDDEEASGLGNHDESTAVTASESQFDFELSPGLDRLLQIVQVAHPVRKTSSAIADSFDFTNHYDNVRYVYFRPGEDRPSINTASLFAWLRMLPTFAEAEGYNWPPSKEDFEDILTRNFGPPKTSEASARSQLDAHWSTISSTIDALALIDDALRSSKIGYLEINDCAAHDEKKIFEIINSAGTQLTAVEILSAKPAWNRPIEDPATALVTDTAALYETMGIRLAEDAPPVVRWDEAATLLDRLDTVPLLGSHS